MRYYAFVAAAFLVAFYAMKRVVDSPLGVIFRAIRENPGRAAAVGYDVKRYKWLAFTIAGGFTGFAGVLYSMMFGIVPLESISWIISGDIVFMVLIGGIGNLYGPLVGAAAFKWLSETVSVVWERWPLILGVALVVVVLFLRGGLVEAFARLRDAVGGRRARPSPARTCACPWGRARGGLVSAEPILRTERLHLRLRRPPRRQRREPERRAGHASLRHRPEWLGQDDALQSDLRRDPPDRRARGLRGAGRDRAALRTACRTWGSPGASSARTCFPS